MFIKMPKEEKEFIITKIQAYFELERGEEIGVLAADQLFDYFLKEIGPYIYNQGVQDSKKMVDQKMMNMEEDILSLEKPIQNFRR